MPGENNYGKKATASGLFDEPGMGEERLRH